MQGFAGEILVTVYNLLRLLDYNHFVIAFDCPDYITFCYFKVGAKDNLFRSCLAWQGDRLISSWMDFAGAST